MTQGVGFMFGAYCLLVASGWLMVPASGWQRGLVYGVVGIGAAAVNWRGRWWRGWDALRVVLAALLLAAIPELMNGWALRHVSGSLWTMAMTLVPAMVVMVAAYMGAEVRRLLVPALAGLGGMLLLIPLEFPGSGVGRIAVGVLVLSAVSVALGSVWMYGLLREVGLAQGIAIFCLTNAGVLVATGIAKGESAGGWTAAVMEGVEAVLLVVLLQRVEPVRLGARFLVIPLLTILEGAVLMRPGVTLRVGMGMLLLAGGAAWLLLAGQSEDAAELSLR